MKLAVFREGERGPPIFVGEPRAAVDAAVRATRDPKDRFVFLRGKVVVGYTRDGSLYDTSWRFCGFDRWLASL